MCGIVGFRQAPGTDSQESMQAKVLYMARAIAHRGPDGEGCWSDAHSGIALGHRRLAILDRSPAGHQPMKSGCDRYVLTYNGEIYNHPDLRLELEQRGYRFRGHSDTEVMLASFAHWGIPGALERFMGMFAFALWDCQDRTLYLARDRMGEKPLYYGWHGDVFLFASELKALQRHPQWQPQIDRDAVALLLRYNYIPAPHSIYQGIYKLIPGTFLALSATAVINERPELIEYWSAKAVAMSGADAPFEADAATGIKHLDSILGDVIRQQMCADVPLGAFLSGGIDSSTVVAIMQAQSARPIKTFTIGFHEAEFNEANRSAAIAKHLGCDHTELYITAKTALDLIPTLPRLYDEPLAESSQIPTFLLAQLARQQVTVSLSGEGSDEVFGGYIHYVWGERIWRTLGWMPWKVRQGLAGGITHWSPQQWNSLFSTLRLPAFYFAPGENLARLAGVLAEPLSPGIYQHLMSQWRPIDNPVLGTKAVLTPLSDPQQWADLSSLFAQMMYLDSITDLPGRILCKVDRATMGASLESRAPFLDRRVVEFAATLPMSLKFRQGQGKWVLRQVLHRYVPPDLVDQPKMGFLVPLDRWLRERALQDWAESLLDRHRLQSEGYFNPDLIRQKWEEHRSGRYNWKSHLWNVLMFQAWLEALGS